MKSLLVPVFCALVFTVNSHSTFNRMAEKEYTTKQQKNDKWFLPPDAIDAPAPKIKQRFQASIIDPRTVNTQSIKRVVESPTEINYRFQTSIVDPRTVNVKQQRGSSEDKTAPSIKYPFRKSIVDPRTADRDTKSKQVVPKLKYLS